jgi:hypothetical protein
MSDIKFDQVSRSEGGTLAKLWRKILEENNYLPAIPFLVNRYIRTTNEMSNRVTDVKRKTKSTLIANITATDMTFKTFTDLLFNFLRVKRIEITVKVTLPNDTVREHSITVKGEDNGPTKQE